MDVRFAQKIVAVATGELGKVADNVDDPGEPLEQRHGWENLKKYYEVAGGFTDSHWRSKGEFGGKEITFLDGVRLKNKRVPQRNEKDGKVFWSGTQWCGIFAAWCWIQAGVPGIFWGFPGVKDKGGKVRIVPDYKNPRKTDLTLGDVSVGDIVVLKDKDPGNALVHHCVVTKLTGESFECVNGNSDYQGILLKNLPRTRINYFYTYKDDLLKVLDYLYASPVTPSGK